jgi:Protein of unknown function (DUF2637)
MSRPDWPRLRLRAFAAVTITSAAVISFDSIRHLAATYGFAQLSWLFPATLDAVAAFGMDLWIRESAAMRSARTLALVAIGMSLVSNVADHWLAQRSVLAAVLGAVPPAMLAALLAVLHRHQAGPHVEPDHGPVAAEPPAVRLVPDAADQAERTAPRKRTASAKRTSVAGTRTAKVPTDGEIVSWIADQPDRVTKAAVMARYPVGSGRALRLMKEATDA